MSRIEIHLIRHGKTAANEQKLYCGRADILLSENGINEIINLRTQGIYPDSAAVFYTSGLMRAAQTLELIYGSVYAEALPLLAEYNFGGFEMKSYEDLKNTADYQAWINDGTGRTPCPNGESRLSFTDRVIKGFNILTEKTCGNSAVLITHGGVIVCVMDYLFPGIRDFYGWHPEPGHGYSLLYKYGRFQDYKIL